MLFWTISIFLQLQGNIHAQNKQASCFFWGGGVSENPDGFPEHEHERESVVNAFKWNSKEEGDLRSPTDGSNSENSESIYTCLRAPFYRETKGLLHS
jgi:hypothetical protein